MKVLVSNDFYTHNFYILLQVDTNSQINYGVVAIFLNHGVKSQ